VTLAAYLEYSLRVMRNLELKWKAKIYHQSTRKLIIIIIIKIIIVYGYLA
jgi:hypothetical protein